MTISLNEAAGRDGIPPEIAFLSRHGVPLAALEIAVQWARHWRVCPVDAVLALELVSEEAFYRALASELDIPVLPASARAGEAAPFPWSLTARLLPLAPDEAGLSLAIAPDGPAIAALFRHRHRFGRAGLAMTSPSRLAALARLRFGSEIADAAAYGLSRQSPGFSAQEGLTAGQRRTLIGIAVVLAGGTALAPSALLAAGMLAAGCVFLAMAVLRLACLLHPRDRSAPPPMGDADLPVYSVIVPLYREARVASQLLHALTALDYPAAKLDIQLVLECDDTQTRAALEACAPPGHIRIVTMPPGWPRTKPRALNAALATARGSCVVIYDAEDLPDPQQLRMAAALFDAFPDVACLQAHIVIDNLADGFIATMFAVEYAALFDAVNPGLAAAGLPLLLGGTSNHLRADVLREIGGWDAWNVTEDADLGIRLARRGHRVMDLPSITREEAPFGWRAWNSQRTRWMKGWMQACITHSRHPLQTWRDLGPIGFVAASTLTLGTVLGALCMPLFVGISAWMLLSEPGAEAMPWPRELVLGFACTVLLSGAAAFLVPIAIGLTRRRRLYLLCLLPLAPFYLLMLTVAAWCGLGGLILDPWHWSKTGHGLSRRRRVVPFTDGR